MDAFCLDALFCVSRLYQRSGGGAATCTHTIVRDFMPLTREIMRCQRANSLLQLCTKNTKLNNKSCTLRLEVSVSPLSVSPIDFVPIILLK